MASIPMGDSSANGLGSPLNKHSGNSAAVVNVIVEFMGAELCAMEDPYNASSRAFIAKSSCFHIRLVLNPLVRTLILILLSALYYGPLIEVTWKLESMEVLKCALDDETSSAIGIVTPTSGAGSITSSVFGQPLTSSQSPIDVQVDLDSIRVIFSYHDLVLAYAIASQLSSILSILSQNAPRSSLVLPIPKVEGAVLVTRRIVLTTQIGEATNTDHQTTNNR